MMIDKRLWDEEMSLMLNFIGQATGKIALDSNKDFNEERANESQRSYRFKIETDYWRLKDNIYTVEVKYFLSDERFPVYLDIRTRGVFEVTPQEDSAILEGELDRLLHVNAAAILFPFLRERVANITTHAGVEPILIQPINFVQAYNENQKAKEQDDK